MSNSTRGAWIPNPEKKELFEETILDTPFIRIVKQDRVSSDGSKRHPFYLLKSQDWCNIIPVTENGNIVLIRQYRVGTERQELEIPGGVVEKSDGPVIEAALRELKEETGYTPLPQGKIVSLGTTYPNPAIQTNRCHFFIVGPVHRSHAQELDPAEMIEVEEHPIADLPKLLRQGEIAHSLVLNAFMKLMMNQPDYGEILTRSLAPFTKEGS